MGKLLVVKDTISSLETVRKPILDRSLAAFSKSIKFVRNKVHSDVVNADSEGKDRYKKYSKEEQKIANKMTEKMRNISLKIIQNKYDEVETVVSYEDRRREYLKDLDTLPGLNLNQSDFTLAELKAADTKFKLKCTPPTLPESHITQLGKIEMTKDFKIGDAVYVKYEQKARGFCVPQNEKDATPLQFETCTAILSLGFDDDDIEQNQRDCETQKGQDKKTENVRICEWKVSPYVDWFNAKIISVFENKYEVEYEPQREGKTGFRPTELVAASSLKKRNSKDEEEKKKSTTGVKPWIYKKALFDCLRDFYVDYPAELSVEKIDSLLDDLTRPCEERLVNKQCQPVRNADLFDVNNILDSNSANGIGGIMVSTGGDMSGTGSNAVAGGVEGDVTKMTDEQKRQTMKVMTDKAGGSNMNEKSKKELQTLAEKLNTEFNEPTENDRPKQNVKGEEAKNGAKDAENDRPKQGAKGGEAKDGAKGAAKKGAAKKRTNK